jgi:PAS domain S-box-containing protein
METLIQILHLEDDSADAELVEAKLAEAGLACRITRVQTCDEFETALRNGRADIILADFRLPTYDGMSALRLVLQMCPDVPFIFISGAMGEEAAIKALTQGATDYVLKQNLSRLASAVQRALEDAKNRHERRIAQAALQRSNDMLRAIIETAPVAIIGLDLEGKVHSVWNAAAEKLLGWNVQEVMGRYLPNVPEEKGEEFHHFREQIRSGMVLKGIEIRWQRRDGTPIDYSIYASPLHDAKGRINGVIIVLVDITVRKLAEEELKKHREHLEELVKVRTAELTSAKEQAEAANAFKSDFLARMSHEIRTPLNVVTGLTSIVLKSELSAEQSDYLKKIQTASNNLLTVINDILDFSKIEADRIELANEPFDLDQLLEQLADLFSYRVAQKDINLIFAVAPQVPRQLAGDPARLTQVLVNLVDNAIKFTEKGEIVVGVELVDAAEKMRGQVALEYRFSDTGIGIAADALPTLFEPFTQAESYLTREHEGTGLGLAICQRLVKLMGGRIWVESTLGKGSTFFFTVLLEARAQKKHPIRLPQDLHGLKTMVVDNSATGRRVLSGLLESFAFNVTAVGSGEKAIEMLRHNAAGEPYQLVLLDWKLPDTDGIEVATAIRSNPDLQFTPIIIMFNGYDHKLVQTHMDMTAVGTYLIKPVKPSQLFNTIINLFSRADAVIPRIETKETAQLDLIAGRRVLVVEDSDLNRIVAVALLTEQGLNAEIATDGRMAVNMVTRAATGYYDAVLMDIQMPIIDGYEATRKIRKLEKERATVCGQPQIRIPIIALTAHAMKGEKVKCLAADMDDYLAKPIDAHQLERVLRKWILPQ